MMRWLENLLQCTFLALFLLTTFWVATKVLWKNPDDALITEFVANLTLRLLLDQRQLLPLHTPFFANSSHFFHFSTLQHFTFFASTFRIFRQTFPFYFPPLLPLFCGFGFLYVPSLAGLQQYLCSKLWEGKISLLPPPLTSLPFSPFFLLIPLSKVEKVHPLPFHLLTF